MNQWHSVKVRDVMNAGGYGLLQEYYNNSLMKALEHVYPELQWRPWEFDKVSSAFWEDIINHRQYLHWMCDQLNIESATDWMTIKLEDVIQHGAEGFLVSHYQGSLASAIEVIYPEYSWNSRQLTRRGQRKSQQRLYQAIKKIYTNNGSRKIQFLLEYKHPQLIYEPSNKSMELDIYIPSLNLAFEYQGKHHYQNNRLFGAAAAYQRMVSGHDS